MIAFRGISAVFRFEWKRSLTVPRMAWWSVLAVFPGLIVTLMRVADSQPPHSDAWIGVLYSLVPGIVCIMGVFLWATPAISSELEGGNWTYLAVRPGGKTSVLLGKYLCAITWTAPAALVGLTIAVIVAAPDDSFRIWRVLALLVLISCPAYGAVYILIGVIFQKRAMVVAVAYTLVFELILALIPAVINQVTVQYHLRALMSRWMEWDTRQGQRFADMKVLFGDAPASEHLLILLGLTVGLLVVAVAVLRHKELAAGADESP